MSDGHTLPVSPVYHAPNGQDSAEEAMPRAFYIDVFTDDDTNTTEHAYYGAALPGRGAIARGCTDRGNYSLADPERFADRVGGILRWA